MSEEQAPESREQPPESPSQAEPGDPPHDDRRASHDDFNARSLEDQERQRRFRLSGLAPGALYDVSGQGANIAVAGPQHNSQYFNYFVDRPTRLVTPLTPEQVRDICECTVRTQSREQLVEYLPGTHVVLLRGEPGSGRRTTAYAALLDWIDDRENARVAMINGDADLSKLTGKDLAGAQGCVIEPNDDAWVAAQHEMLTHLRSVAREAGCRIVVLLTGAGTGGEFVVRHDPPPAMEVFQAWVEYRLEEPDAWKQRGFDNREAQLKEMLDGWSPSQAGEKAHEVVYGLRRGRRLEEFLRTSKKTVRQRLQQELTAKVSSFSRCFLISSGVFHDLTEPVVSRAALRLEELIRCQENERTRPGPPVWEPMQSLLEYEGLRAEPRPAQGDGHRIWLRGEVRDQVLQVAWEEVPALRGILHDWLREFTKHEDQRVATRAAQAVARLAACDFEAVRSEFLEPWSDAGYGGKELAKVTLEAAWSLDSDLAQRTLGLLEIWSKGNYERRMAAAIAYGSQIGVNSIDKALPSFKRVVQHSRSSHLHGLVAQAIAEVYVEKTAEQILRELRQWTGDQSPYGLRRTAALAPIWLACLPPEVFPGRVVLAEEAMHKEVAALLCHALDWSRPGLRPDRTPPVWHLLARWAGDSSCRPIVKEITAIVGIRYRHLRMPLLFHLRAWRAQGLVAAEQLQILHDLLKRGGHACSG